MYLSIDRLRFVNGDAYRKRLLVFRCHLWSIWFALASLWLVLLLFGDDASHSCHFSFHISVFFLVPGYYSSEMKKVLEDGEILMGTELIPLLNTFSPLKT